MLYVAAGCVIVGVCADPITVATGAECWFSEECSDMMWKSFWTVQFTFVIIKKKKIYVVPCHSTFFVFVSVFVVMILDTYVFIVKCIVLSAVNML